MKVVSTAPSAKSKEQISHRYITSHVPAVSHNRDLPLKENYNSESNTSEVESSTLSMAESTEEVQARVVSPALKPRKPLHKRKGKPQRAPLY